MNPFDTPTDSWLAVDLDSTLAEYDGWKGPQHIGAPIPSMVQIVKDLVDAGIDVRILTARVAPGKDNKNECRYAIELWLAHHLGFVLPITHAKDHLMYALIDDRAIQVAANTGCILERELALYKASRDFWVSQLPPEKLAELNKLDPINMYTERKFTFKD